MMWHGGWYMGGGMVVWWIVGLALVVAVVWAVVTVAGTHAPNVPNRGESAEDILRRRFARGEIDQQEYRQRLDELRR